MVCEMGDDYTEDMDMDAEILTSMWPEDVASEAGRKFNVEKPGPDQDMLKEVTILEDPSMVDFKRLYELTNYSEKGSSQLAYLVKNWEYKQANAVRLLNEELDILSKQRQEVELKKLEILEEHRFEGETYAGDKRPISILDEIYDIWEDIPRRKNDVVIQNKRVEIDAEYDTIKYWKQRAMQLDKLLEASIQREQILVEKLQENISYLERQSSPVEELSQILKRADNFLHFVLQNAPVVIGHLDKDLRYRFIYNHFPSLQEEDILGKTDMEIFSGAGVKESQEFKKEVLERGLPAKREITFETPLFGSKTFLIYVEPVFSKAGEKIGVNYMGMDITDQVIKREKMAMLREEIAVQKAKETELNKTIHITEETMRAKQMLATMSHEIRSPLTGVVSMAEILSNSKLDREQRQLLDVMISSGDLVLQLINDILDLSKVESGVMKLEATKFRPREVVNHVLQTAAASLQKELTLEGHVAEDVPAEVIGDVLRIRQILTNLISNAIKFTHEGKVGIDLYVVQDPSAQREGYNHKFNKDQSEHPANEIGLSENNDQTGVSGNRSSIPVSNAPLMDGDQEKSNPPETTVWIRCDVHDTGIGIPENAIPTLFKKYMQVSADHARKYGGTGLGLAICKQLVELMGGHLTVNSREHCGSTFTFLLPYKVSPRRDPSDDPAELSDADYHEAVNDSNNDDNSECYFHFKPRTLGSLFSSGGSTRTHKISASKSGYDPLNKLNNLSKEPYSFPSTNCMSREITLEDASSVTDAVMSLSEPGSSLRQDPEQNKAMGVFGVRNSKANGLGLGLNSLHCKKMCMEVDNMNKTSKFQEHENSVRSPHNLHENSVRSLHRQESENSVRSPLRQENENSVRSPHRQEHENSVGSPHRRSQSNTELPKPNLKPKILLVEDNKINVMVTKSMMKQLGHGIEVVNNGVEAVRAVQSNRYDLILMDVCMPVMDGLQATRLIRSFEETGSWDAAVEAGVDPPEPSISLANGLDADPSRRRVPVIAMTANALSESAEECLANGMDSFVSKPVTFQKLKECLQQYIPC